MRKASAYLVYKGQERSYKYVFVGPSFNVQLLITA